jgi:hypothetical protein
VAAAAAQLLRAQAAVRRPLSLLALGSGRCLMSRMERAQMMKTGNRGRLVPKAAVAAALRRPTLGTTTFLSRVSSLRSLPPVVRHRLCCTCFCSSTVGRDAANFISLTVCCPGLLAEDEGNFGAAAAHRGGGGGGSDDEDLQLALQMSREAAERPQQAERESMDEQLQLALAASRSEADELARRQAAAEQADDAFAGAGVSDNSARGGRGGAGRRAPPPAGAEVLVLDSSDDSSDDEASASGPAPKRRRLKDR